jgi:hypothetical protein
MAGRFLVVLTVATFAMGGVASDRPVVAKQGPRAHDVRLVLVGDEYSDPQANVLTSRCPTPTTSGPGCWTWRAAHLGRASPTNAVERRRDRPIARAERQIGAALA